MASGAKIVTCFIRIDHDRCNWHQLTETKLEEKIFQEYDVLASNSIH